MFIKNNSADFKTIKSGQGQGGLKNQRVTPLGREKKSLSWVPVLMVLLFYLAGCPPHPPPPVAPPPSVPMVEVPLDQRPAFSDDMNFEGLAQAIDFSLAYLNRLPRDNKFTFGQDRYSTGHLIASLSHFRKFLQTRPSSAALNSYILDYYKVYQSIGDAASQTTLFTGYYEPSLAGSLKKTDRYRFPVYPRPSDLVTIDLSSFSNDYQGKTLVGRVAGDRVVPYHDRDAIEKGVLSGSVIPIAWVDDRIGLFFLQVQGSGKINLDNGSVLNIHYHASNGKAYRSVGALLIEQGKISKAEMSMQRIRAYLDSHPEEVESVLSYNPSYVFFKTEPNGPLGCLDVKLTPGRSLAVDRRIFPMAGLSFIQTQKPVVSGNGAITGWTDCSRFVLNQDTGGAIKGPGRADLFWGNGAYAELAAGHLQHPGRLYFLILKPGLS